MSKVIVLCIFCNWKTIAEENEVGLKELKNDTLSSKKYRCPRCGRAISPRKFGDPQKEQDRKENEDKMKKENETWIRENLDFQKKFAEEINDEQ
jgi:uncharacterized protein YlaI